MRLRANKDCFSPFRSPSETTGLRCASILFPALVVIAMIGSVACLPGCDNAVSSAPSPGDRTGNHFKEASNTSEGKSEETTKSDKKTESKPETQASTIQDKTFDDIKFEMEKTDPFERKLVTPEIENLSGKRIRIRGFILPPYVRTGLDQFVLVRDNQECCFGPGAALYDCILVRMEEGKTTDYTELPVAVEGTFRIERFPPDSEERPLAIYQMVGESVE